MRSRQLSDGVVIFDASLIYIMLGAMLAVGGGLWFVIMRSYDKLTGGTYFVSGSFLVGGITLVVIGFSLGRIARDSQQAEARLNADREAAMIAEEGRPIRPKI